MITQELKDVFDLAASETKARNQDLVTTEHLLYAMLSSKSVVGCLNFAKANVADVKSKVLAVVDACPISTFNDGIVEQSAKISRLLTSTSLYTMSLGKYVIDSLDVLVCMFSLSCKAANILTDAGVTRQHVKDFAATQTQKAKNMSSPKEENKETEEKGEKEDPLKQYTVNLIQKALDGKIDPMIGRENELARIIHILARRRKNNPIMVGESGVGKTAIAEGLALAVSKGNVPECLKNAEIYSLDSGTLVAGTKYRGDFEARIKEIIKALQSRPNAILFIDEIHTLIGAGRSSDGGAMDAANILKPALSSGELRCIGSTTYKEYQGSFEKDKAFSRRFQKIDVCELTVEETVKVLEGIKSQYEKHHSVGYTASAVRLCAELAKKYINDRFLPDSAIDILDESGASKKLEITTKKKIVRDGDVEKVVARIARIPELTLSASAKNGIVNIEPELKKLIFGQDEAIETITKAIKVSRSGLCRPNKPIAAVCFAGPTGVGKTQLARDLATVSGMAFRLFNMSEYAEKHEVSKLLGAAPGYVGFDSTPAQLTDFVTKNPNSVIVFDEAEKSHPDVMNIFLSIMDDANVVDNMGRKADFKGTVIVFTTNAGAREMEKQHLGFGNAVNTHGAKTALDSLFAPEFRNRLTATVIFNHLGTDVVKSIAKKNVQELEEQLKPKKIALKLTEAALRWLMEHGYSSTFGARPMARLVDTSLRTPLAELIVSGGSDICGKTIQVDAGEVGLTLEVMSEVCVAV